MKTYTEDQIKAAFWAMFHKSGEHWFPDRTGTPETCSSTTSAWDEFKQELGRASDGVMISQELTHEEWHQREAKAGPNV